MTTGSPAPYRAGSVSNRRHERITLEESPVEILVENTGIRSLFAKTSNCGVEVIDLSESGMRALVTRQLAPNLRIRFVAKINYFGETFEGAARVVWCSRSQMEGKFVIGIDFTELPDGHYQRVGLLRKTLKSPEMWQKLKTRKRAAFHPNGKPEKPEGQEGLEFTEPPSH